MDILRFSDQIGSRTYPNRFAEALNTSIRLTRLLPHAAGLLWALTLSIAGGLMVLAAPSAVPWLATTLLFAGLTGFISGLFVFQVAVANKIFPNANPRLIRNVEAVSGVILMLGFALTALTLLP